MPAILVFQSHTCNVLICSQVLEFHVYSRTECHTWLLNYMYSQPWNFIYTCTCALSKTTTLVFPPYSISICSQILEFNVFQTTECHTWSSNYLCSQPWKHNFTCPLALRGLHFFSFTIHNAALWPQKLQFNSLKPYLIVNLPVLTTTEFLITLALLRIKTCTFCLPIIHRGISPQKLQFHRLKPRMIVSLPISTTVNCQNHLHFKVCTSWLHIMQYGTMPIEASISWPETLPDCQSTCIHNRWITLTLSFLYFKVCTSGPPVIKVHIMTFETSTSWSESFIWSSVHLYSWPLKDSFTCTPHIKTCTSCLNSNHTSRHYDHRNFNFAAWTIIWALISLFSRLPLTNSLTHLRIHSLTHNHETLTNN